MRLHGGALLALSLATLHGAAALEYLSYYGTNVTLQHEWLNLAIAGGATVDEFWQYKIPSLLPMPETGVFSRGSRDSSGKQIKGSGLVDGWEGVLTTFANDKVLPRLKNKTAVGVFLGVRRLSPASPAPERPLHRATPPRSLPTSGTAPTSGTTPPRSLPISGTCTRSGRDRPADPRGAQDEICCHNSSCWHGQLYPISAKLRSLLGRDAILYENECGDSLAGGGMAHGHPVGPPLDKVAPDLDLISVDLYEGYLPSDPNGTAEAVAARAFVEKEVYPRLAPHQKIMVVPGTFGCSNTSFMPLALTQKSVVEKLKAYFEWGKADPRMAGINPCEHPTPLRLPTAACSSKACADGLSPLWPRAFQPPAQQPGRGWQAV